MSEIRITYVTITYNAAKVLKRTLDSVLEQDYPNIEHLIIDGASTDDTLKMVNDYIAQSDTGNIRARQGYLRCYEQRSEMPHRRLRMFSECRRFPACTRYRHPHSAGNHRHQPPITQHLATASSCVRRHRHCGWRGAFPAPPPTGTTRTPYVEIVPPGHAGMPSGFLCPCRLCHCHTLRHAVSLFGRC